MRLSKVTPNLLLVVRWIASKLVHLLMACQLARLSASLTAIVMLAFQGLTQTLPLALNLMSDYRVEFGQKEAA